MSRLKPYLYRTDDGRFTLTAQKDGTWELFDRSEQMRDVCYAVVEAEGVIIETLKAEGRR